MMDLKQKMIDAVIFCLKEGKAESLSESEISRCMHGRAAEGALTMYAKEFIGDGIIDLSSIK